MSAAALLCAALLLDAVFGEPDWLWSRVPHPAVMIGRVVGWLDLRLNRGSAKRLFGLFAVAVLLVGAISLGQLLSLFGPVVEILAAAVLLAQRSLVQHVQAVADALRLSVGDGRLMVARIVSRDCREMDQSRVARAAIESASENLSDGVVAPALWFLIGGLPGLLAYKAINTADSMIGYRNPRYEAFGWAAARCDDLMNLVPARLTGLLIAALCGRLGDWAEIARDARRHRSPNAGWPESAMARALGIALAGPRSYDGRMRDLAWVNGSARKSIGAAEIDASIRVLWRVWGAVLALAAMLTLL